MSLDLPFPRCHYYSLKQDAVAVVASVGSSALPCAVVVPPPLPQARLSIAVGVLAVAVAVMGAPADQNVAQIIANHPNLTMFNYFLQHTGLSYALTANGPYTIFGACGACRGVMFVPFSRVCGGRASPAVVAVPRRRHCA